MADRRVGLMSAACGISVGQAASWWGFYPAWHEGHLGGGAVATQVALTVVEGICLVLIALALLRGRSRSSRPM